jgi:hypothetical protein
MFISKRKLKNIQIHHCFHLIIVKKKKKLLFEKYLIKMLLETSIMKSHM